jgi:molybdopterin synthase catalytic subunit
MRYFKLTYDEIELDTALSELRSDDLGAHVVFVGTVRNFAKNKEVVALEFEAYEPMALSELELIANELELKWNVRHVLLHHRLGRVEVGGIPVIAIVSSVHRSEAFEACAYMMDRLKESVPIWKKEIFTDGSAWVSPNP